MVERLTANPTVVGSQVRILGWAFFFLFLFLFFSPFKVCACVVIDFIIVSGLVVCDSIRPLVDRTHRTDDATNVTN